MKLEAKGLTGLQRFKLPSAARLPEINFIDSRLLGEKFKPIIIRNADITFHQIPLVGLV